MDQKPFFDEIIIDTNPDVWVWIVSFNQFPKALYFPWLTSKDRSNFEQVQSKTRQHEIGGGRGLLRKLLSEKWGLPMENYDLQEDSLGKPKLVSTVTNNARLPHFNISHSRSHLAIAISSSTEVGIDLEESVRFDNYRTNLAKKWLHEEESIQLTSLENSKRRDFLLKKWVQKEALSKYLGWGFHLEFKTINIHQSLNQASNGLPPYFVKSLHFGDIGLGLCLDQNRPLCLQRSRPI